MTHCNICSAKNDTTCQCDNSSMAAPVRAAAALSRRPSAVTGRIDDRPVLGQRAVAGVLRGIAVQPVGVVHEGPLARGAAVAQPPPLVEGAELSFLHRDVEEEIGAAP